MAGAPSGVYTDSSPIGIFGKGSVHFEPLFFLPAIPSIPEKLKECLRKVDVLAFVQ